MAAIVIIEFFIRMNLLESTMCKTSSKTIRTEWMVRE